MKRTVVLVVVLAVLAVGALTHRITWHSAAQVAKSTVSHSGRRHHR